METVYQLLAIVAAGLLVWLLYHQIKHHPELFSKENMSKSFTTLGILGLLLIVLVAGTIFMLRM